MNRSSLLLLAPLLACARSAAPPDCEAMGPGLDRDACLFNQVLALPETERARVGPLCDRIADPVVRTAAIDRWTRDHAAALSPQEGQALCQRLPPAEASACTRRLSSAHLRR